MRSYFSLNKTSALRKVRVCLLCIDSCASKTPTKKRNAAQEDDNDCRTNPATPTACVCVYACVFFPFILDVRPVDVPAGVA